MLEDENKKEIKSEMIPIINKRSKEARELEEQTQLELEIMRQKKIKKSALKKKKFKRRVIIGVMASAISVFALAGYKYYVKHKCDEYIYNQLNDSNIFPEHFGYHDYSNGIMINFEDIGGQQQEMWADEFTEIIVERAIDKGFSVDEAAIALHFSTGIDFSTIEGTTPEGRHGYELIALSEMKKEKSSTEEQSNSRSR